MRSYIEMCRGWLVFPDSQTLRLNTRMSGGTRNTLAYARLRENHQNLLFPTVEIIYPKENKCIWRETTPRSRHRDGDSLIIRPPGHFFHAKTLKRRCAAQYIISRNETSATTENALISTFLPLCLFFSLAYLRGFENSAKH